MKPNHLPFLRRFCFDIMLLATACFLPAIYLIFIHTSQIESLSFVLISLLLFCFYLRHTVLGWRGCDVVEQSRLIQSGLGPATRITLLRGTILACISGTLGLNNLTEPVSLIMPLCFLAAILLDAVDGLIARKTDSLSAFGRALDTITDGFAMAVGVAVAVRHQLLPPDFLAVGAAYYLFILAARNRQRLQRPLYPLIPGTFRRTMAGFLMGFVAVTLFGIYSLKAVNIPARIYMLTFLSGFFLDWLTASGRMDIANDQYARPRSILYRSLFYTLPLVLRVFLCFLVVVEFRDHHQYFLLLTLSSLLVLGIAARTVAVTLMFLIGWYIMNEYSGHYAQLALAYSSTIAILGAGASAIWEPEEKWLNR